MNSALHNALFSAALLLLCLSAQPVICAEDDWPLEEPACLPELPPGSDKPDGTAPAVLLQMHRWVWIENITEPDWAPRTEYSALTYYFVRPGYLLNLTVPFITLNGLYSTRVSVLTNGNTLCMAGMTMYRETSRNGTTNSLVCNSTCFRNFTSAGRTMNLPVLVYTQDTILKRSTEYLAVDGLDPEERASYKCMGLFVDQQLDNLPSLRDNVRQCPDGDMCLFNFDGNVIDAGCKSSFTFDFCVGNHSLCDYTSGRNCPICCRGDFCNRAVADEVYKAWGAKESNDSRASSMTVLAAAALSLLWLRSAQ